MCAWCQLDYKTLLKLMVTLIQLYKVKLEEKSNKMGQYKEATCGMLEFGVFTAALIAGLNRFYHSLTDLDSLNTLFIRYCLLSHIENFAIHEGRRNDWRS